MQNKILEAFWKSNGINAPADGAIAGPAIVALETARPVFSTAFDTAPLPGETSGLVLRAFENLSDRIYEQAAGMLVCLATGSAAASETIARTVIEGSFNLLFIVSQNHEPRLFAFLHQHLNEHDRRLQDWHAEELSADHDPARRNVVLGQITETRNTNQMLGDFINNLGKGLGFDKPEELTKYWPRTLKERCREIDKAGHYLTSYHRLSASSHIDAEETIRWLFGYYVSHKDDNPQILEKMGRETVSFSAMMSRIAVMHYLDATSATCRILEAEFDERLIGKIKSDLVRSIDEIRSDAGCPS